MQSPGVVAGCSGRFRRKRSTGSVGELGRAGLVVVPSLIAEESAEGLEDGAAGEAALDEEEGEEEEDGVGGPSGGDGGELAGVAEGEEDFGEEEHEGGEDDGDGEGAAGAAAGVVDAEGGGEEDGDEAEPGLGPAVVELGFEGAGEEGGAVGVGVEPVVELGDAEVAGVEAFLDEEGGGFGPVVDEEFFGEVGLVFGGGLGLGEEADGVVEDPLFGFAEVGGLGGFEAVFEGAVLVEGGDFDVEEGGVGGEVVGEAADEPEAAVIGVVVEDVGGLGGGAAFGGFEKGFAVAFGPGGEVVVEKEGGEGEEAAEDGEGEEEAEDAAAGLGHGDDFAGGGELAEGVEEAEEDGEGEEEDEDLGEEDAVVGGEEGEGVFGF